METDFEKMMQMMELMKLFQNTGNAPTGSTKAKSGESFNFYDDSIQTPELKSIKAAIPYLDLRYQKSLGIMVKMIEIQRLLEMYGGQVQTVSARNADWRREMLMAIRPHIDNGRQDMVDLLIKYMDIKKILQKSGGAV